jgi:hypothetical protein
MNPAFGGSGTLETSLPSVCDSAMEKLNNKIEMVSNDRTAQMSEFRRIENLQT